MAHVKGKNPNKNKVREAPVNPFNGRVYQPALSSEGASPVDPWNWKELPEDHTERVRIEKMFAKLRPVRTTFGNYGGRGQP